MVGRTRKTVAGCSYGLACGLSPLLGRRFFDNIFGDNAEDGASRREI